METCRRNGSNIGRRNLLLNYQDEWDDPDNLYHSHPRKEEITEKNLQTLEKALYPIRKKG